MISNISTDGTRNSEPEFYTHMSKDELIGYCDIHRKTERALFSYPQIAQMIEYAGRPEEFVAPEELMRFPKAFDSLHEEMKTLVDLARELSKEGK